MRPALRAVLLPSIALVAEPVYPPKPSWKDERIRRAEVLYHEGYQLYANGEPEKARLIFDQALDLVLDSSAEPVNQLAFDKRFEDLVDKIYRTDVDTVRKDAKSAALPYDRAPIDDILSLTFPIDPKLKPKVKDQVAATVSQLPLEANDAVLSFINYFRGERGRQVLIAGLKRAGKYKPMISRILDEEGIPQEFIFLAQAESGFLPRAVSYMAAGGMWQFIPGRGAEYGLRRTEWVDERFDPEMATRAAARHLRDLYHYFGDWYLAIAAYNCGPGNVERAIERTGYADVWELRSRGTLPLETSNYVPIILAMTIMAKNPASYGLEDLVVDAPMQKDTVEIPSLTSLNLISDILGLTVAELRDLNPALLRDMAPAGYRLHIPRAAGPALVAGLSLVPTERRATWRVHRIGATDTLASLTAKYRTTLSLLQTANTSLSEDLTPGSLVVIPSAPPAAPVARTPARGVAARPGMQTASKAPAAKPASPNAVRGPAPATKKAAPAVARTVVRKPSS
jgi:membrane-bound lytic murein transglycosylase D